MKCNYLGRALARSNIIKGSVIVIFCSQSARGGDMQRKVVCERKKRAKKRAEAEEDGLRLYECVMSLQSIT